MINMFTIAFIYSILILILLLINNVWLVPIILNVDSVEKGINVLKNVSAVLIVIMMSQMYIGSNKNEQMIWDR